jgi:hypothetical protein
MEKRMKSLAMKRWDNHKIFERGGVRVTLHFRERGNLEFPISIASYFLVDLGCGQSAASFPLVLLIRDPPVSHTHTQMHYGWTERM